MYACKAVRRDRTIRAFRLAVRHADRRTELHERLREVAAAALRVYLAKRGGEFFFKGSVVDRGEILEYTRAHAQHVSVHGGARLLKADRGDRPGGVVPDAGEFT